MIVIPAKYSVIKNFLPVDFNQQLLDFTLSNEHLFLQRASADYAPKQLGFCAPSGFEYFKEIIVNKVKEVLPDVIKQLDLTIFPVELIECQVSCHKAGGHLGIHQDNSPEYPTNRLLTYVYYFGAQSRQLEGGQLVIYNDAVINSYDLKFERHNSGTIIKPENNTIVFFLSRNFHEVLSVSSDGNFINSRFSCHGWIRT